MTPVSRKKHAKGVASAFGMLAGRTLFAFVRRNFEHSNCLFCIMYIYIYIYIHVILARGTQTKVSSISHGGS